MESTIFSILQFVEAFGHIYCLLREFCFKSSVPSLGKKILSLCCWGWDSDLIIMVKKRKELFSILQDKRDAKQLAAISMFESTFQAKYIQ